MMQIKIVQVIQVDEYSWGWFERALFRGRSSAGRAPALQAGGRRFDPVRLHHFMVHHCVVRTLFCERFYKLPACSIEIVKRRYIQTWFFVLCLLNRECYKEWCVARECSNPLLMIGSLTAPLSISREAGLFCWYLCLFCALFCTRQRDVDK